MNGIVSCDLSTELCMTATDDPKASKEYRTTEYMFPYDPSAEYLKKMFCDLFMKRIEITLNNRERIVSVRLIK